MSENIPVFFEGGGSIDAIVEDFFLNTLGKQYGVGTEAAYVRIIGDNGSKHSGASGYTPSGGNYSYYVFSTSGNNTAYSQSGGIPGDSFFYSSYAYGMSNTNPIITRYKTLMLVVNIGGSSVVVYDANTRLPFAIGYIWVPIQRLD